MDTMYRNGAKENEEALSAQKKQEKRKHASDSYQPKIRPRETHPDAVDSETRITKNLNKLNRRLVDSPVSEKEIEEAHVVNEDRGAKIITRATAAKRPIPLATIVSCVLLALVFMYMLTLYVQVEEYSLAIDTMESEIASLKEEATQLEVQLENKYDLDEVERIATQEYGMVAASTLSKKYISVTDDEDLWIEAEGEQEEESSFLAGIFGKEKN
ncbi:MAG: hypothetical protein IKJ74_00055 [Clostridia bacterium]|nr:hypothetical protein [Clostridia bacterium]